MATRHCAARQARIRLFAHVRSEFAFHFWMPRRLRLTNSLERRCHFVRMGFDGAIFSNGAYTFAAGIFRYLMQLHPSRPKTIGYQVCMQVGTCWITCALVSNTLACWGGVQLGTGRNRSHEIGSGQSLSGVGVDTSGRRHAFTDEISPRLHVYTPLQHCSP